MKRCPYCAEEILDEAIKCRYCHSMLEPPRTEAQLTDVVEASLLDPNPSSDHPLDLAVPGIAGGRLLVAGIGTVVVFLIAWLLQEPASPAKSAGGVVVLPSVGQSVAPAVELSSLPIPIRIGMSWDECLPLLQKAKRVSNIRETPNRFTDMYRIGDQGYNLQFERPAEPAAGPYRLVHIIRVKLPPDVDVKLSERLKRGMVMGEALPVMQEVGGHFVIETKDRFSAVLLASDGTYRVTFERPPNVSRPEVIADATPSVLALMGRIPLHALPEFSEYRIVAIKRDK